MRLCQRRSWIATCLSHPGTSALSGGLTKKWEAAPADSPKRDFSDVVLIAEMVSRFDVVGVQEVRGDLRALRYLLKALGPEWGFTLTDVTKGDAGNNERMAFLFDTLHVDYGSSQERIDELRAIAEWLSAWAEQEDEWNHNLIALGDFNIDRRGDPLYDAFTSTGLTPAPGLSDVPRTIFQSGKEKFYDQIAWFIDANKGPLLTLACTTAGSFDFVPIVQGATDLVSLSWKISDHYPLWGEFAIPARARV